MQLVIIVLQDLHQDPNMQHILFAVGALILTDLAVGLGDSSKYS